MIRKHPDPIELRKVRDFGEIINDTFLFIRRNVKPLIRVFFMYCGVFVLAAIVALIFQQLKTVDMYNGVIEERRVNTAAEILSLYGKEYVAAILAVWLLYTLLIVSVVSFMALYTENGNRVPGNDQIWERIKQTFFMTLASSVVWLFLLVVGFILCVAPGIYLLPISSLFYVALVAERCSFTEAWQKSFRLIKENWWTSFGVLFVMYLVVYFCTMIIALPTTIINLIAVMGKTKTSLSYTVSIIGVILQGLCYVFLIVPVIASALLYYSWSEQKDGEGLLGRISAFSQTGQATHDDRPESY